MAGKVIDDNATGVLVLIIPIALVLVLLFTAWPVVLLLVLLGSAWSIWQRYQWLQLSQQYDPIFHQLIQENRGCLTVLDLAMKANIAGSLAKRYLDTKAQEFGIRPLEYEEKGRVYYFITGSTIGGLIDDSESPPEFEREPATVAVQAQIIPPTETTQPQQEQATVEVQASVEPPAETKQSKEEQATVEAQAPIKSPTKIQETLPKEQQATESPSEEQEEPADNEPPKKLMPFGSLIQIELAQRLQVHSSTVYKRRYDSDFPEWSRSRDPEGIAWEYSEDTKEFYPVETKKPKQKS